MFQVAAHCLTTHHYSRYRRVDVLSDGRHIRPMTCLKLSAERNKEHKWKIKVTPHSLYNIIKSTTKTIKKIEKEEEKAEGTEGIYLYKTTSLQGAWLKGLSGFTIPKTDDKNGCYYYKCNMDIKGLYTTAIDLIEFDKALKNWWTLDTNDEVYRKVLNVAPYKIGLVTSVLHTSRPVELTTEIIWIPDTEQHIIEDRPYKLKDTFPKHETTGQSQQLVIPEGTTLAYQYVQLDVEADERIHCMFSDVPGTLMMKDMSDELELISHDAESEKFEKGCPVIVLTSSTGNQYELVENSLTRILTRPEVLGLPVCVYSIAGAYRGGKTFLLNFFKKFLEGKHVPDWLTGQTSSSSQSFFEYEGGDDAHTKGLVLWSKPFVVETPSNGKVAVLLMDTQGTFDHESSEKDCATIFALSTMLASTQVLNIRRQIQENDLKSLQFFMEYGKFASKDQGSAVKNQDKASKGPKSATFQSLHFLIRDYPNDTSKPESKEGEQFGFKGGEKHLKKALKTSGAKTEGVLLRKAITDMFEDIVCFLLPRPSTDVQDGAEFDYNNPTGNPDDKRFITHVQDLVYSLLASENLVVKKQSGEKLTSETFLVYFKELAKLFTEGNMPRLESVVETTANANNMMAVIRSKDSFDLAMQTFVSDVSKAGYMADKSFEGAVAREKKNAITEFKYAPKFGGDTYAEKHLEDLKQSLTISEKRYKHMIADIPTESEAKQNCEAAIESCMKHFFEEGGKFQYSKKDADTLEISEISAFFETLEKDVVEKFNRHRQLGGEEMSRSALNKLKGLMKKSRKTFEKNLSVFPTMDQAVRSQEEAYKVAETFFRDEQLKAMETELRKDHVEIQFYKKEIEKIKTSARDKFNHHEKKGGRKLEKEFMDKLEKCMIDAYNETADIVENKKQENAVCYTAYSTAKSMYTIGMDAFLDAKMTVEENEVKMQHHKMLEKCKDVMIQHAHRCKTTIQPSYLDRLNKECQQRHEEIWMELCRKPSKHQLEKQNTEVVSECLKIYKDSMTQFLNEKLKTGKCKYEDIPTNHTSCRQIALDEFESSEVLGDRECIDEYQNKLCNQINELYNERRDHLMANIPPEVRIIRETRCVIM